MIKITPNIYYIQYIDLKCLLTENSVISNGTYHPWLACSPDLSPLDYWWWGLCLSLLRDVKPSSMAELVTTINDFAASIPSADVKKAVNNIMARADVCLAENGGHFEHNLKMQKRRVEK